MSRKSTLIIGLLLVGLLLLPVIAIAGSGVTGGDPSFTKTDAEEEGYWYSRYNLGNLVMRSGLGETFMPEPAMIQKMIQMVDANPDDGDTAAPAKNVTLIKSVYASGDPHYVTKLDVNDFATQRWDPATFDKNVTSSAMAWTIIKETEWSKQFHVDSHFGTPADDFGAQWRFVGMVMNANSLMQSKYALEKMRNEQGLFANSDGAIDWNGQWAMLEALSDVGGLLKADHVPNSATNRYKNPPMAAMFLGAADAFFNTIASRQPSDTRELSLAVQGLTWYAASTGNAANKAAAIDLIGKFGDQLVNANKDDATRKAFAIRGLIEAYRTTGNNAYRDAAAEVFTGLAGEYDAGSGVFSSQNVYSIDNVAAIMGAINSSMIFLGDAIDQNQAKTMFTGFFESAVNMSGLQQSVPPIPVAKGKFEQDEPPMYYGYPGIPKPPMAGGEFGVAPVFATEVKWDGGQWQVTNARFDSAGAMHASNEFIWFHNDEVNGFPRVSGASGGPTTLPTTGGSWFQIILARISDFLGF